MIEKYKFNGKNLEDALNNCYKELGTTIENIYYIETKTEAKLFKAKKVEIEVIEKREVIGYIKEYLVKLLKDL